ncbi:gliding motility-associated C-terminal domain-containing protein [Patiriisocius hiemis]|uniref:Gliding motility-associated C-terminal domain-containing protein n=1 Tax=Patiriisocius hiemis TaxID=3075604 RepID=A0ABU2Y9K5_9FLAO|nr:gliding motility-associated C-terminal domain-containing protein [Constantimarinum sp. W242]MDT0554859.1 gliding motility-associated C-terminal domain-containing protein [Constantimarinum sp. W242]
MKLSTTIQWGYYVLKQSILFSLVLGITTSANAQTKIVANQITFESNVDNSANTVIENGDFGTLNSYGGIAIGVGAYSGELEVEYPATVPANTTSYVRIDFDEDFLNCLLGGNLGGLLADLVGNIIFGDHYFEIEARNGTTTVLSNTSTNPPSSESFRIVVDKDGNYYIAITPDQDYNRIYIEDNTDALLLGVLQSTDVYNAFYFTDNQCATDPLFTDFDGDGITLDAIQLGGAGVTNPEFAIDDDPDNYSEISMGTLGILGSMEQTVYFPNPYTPTDDFNVTLAVDPTLLTLGLLNNVEVSAWNGTQMVFEQDIASVINLDVLTLLQNGQRADVLFEPGATFDRVSISISSLVSVNLAQSLDFYGVTIMGTVAPTTNSTDQDFCVVNNPTVADIQVNEGNVTWYDAPTDGTAYEDTDPLINGNSYYATQTIDGCESEERLEVTVSIGDAATPTTNSPNQNFCLVNNPTVANLQVNETVTWYNAPIDGAAYNATDPLIDGAAYYAAQTVDGCESSVRLEVVANVDDAATPTTSNTDQDFCVVDNPTVADIQVNETVTWYDAPTDGTAYDSTDPLIDGTIYYAAQTVDGCESSVRLAVDINVGDAPTPTTNSTNQDFCVVDNPTVADIQVNETVTWYDAPIAGTAYDALDLLIDGATYYAAQIIDGCESSTRLAVLINVGDASTPTTNNPSQDFCVVDNPTVADIQVNETVTWYDTPIGGTAYAPTDLLIDGTTYYAAQVIGSCESSDRLAVAVSVGDASTPTTNSNNQDFCLANSPTVADIQVNETVTWYDAPTGGNPYSTTAPLIDGTTYFASQIIGNCESSQRLAVTVEVGNTPTPTTDDTSQGFCLIETPTVSDIQVNETVTWYDAPTGGNPYASTDPLIDGNTYYASQIIGGCESSQRLAVLVTIGNAETPTTENPNQDFCVVENPTVGDLQVNETVTWYDAPTEGTPYTSTDLLVNGGTYYAAQIDNGCESSERLAVNVTISDAPTPTTESDTQDFCLMNNPTVADIQVNETVTWYDTPTGGNPYDSSDPLVNGVTYYAAQTVDGCESSLRLEVTVSIGDAPTPTTNNTEQDFCATDNPTVADIQVNETVIWYDAPTEGNPYASTDALIDGNTYYASQIVDGCESSQRLAVLVILNGVANPLITSDAGSQVCLSTAVTYTTEASNSDYIWNVTGGTVMDGGGSNDNFVTVLWDELENTNVEVSYETPSACGSSATTTLNETVEVCADLTITKTVNNPTPMVGENVTFTITVTNNGPNDFVDLSVEELMPSGYEMVNFNTSIGSYNATTGIWSIELIPTDAVGVLRVVGEVLGQGDYLNTASIMESNPIDADTQNNIARASIDPVCLFVYNEFSPNGDGINDTLVISCIENFPNNQIQVFNRYGSLVYKEQNYSNNWNGVGNVNGVSKRDQLPSDTYYYVLELGNNEKPKTGWLFLIK